jgi:hypothetical protein
VRELRVRIFESRVLTEKVWFEVDGVKECWNKVRNEKRHYQYQILNIICLIKPRPIRWAGHVTWMGEQLNACRVFVGKHEGKRALVRHRSNPLSLFLTYQF